MGPRHDGLDTPPAVLFAAQATASEPTYAVARSGRGSRVRRFGGPALCRTAGCGDLRRQPDGQARIRTHAGAGAAESKEPSEQTECVEDCLRALKLMDRKDPVVTLVAKRIIDLAKHGERDPASLRERVLQ